MNQVEKLFRKIKQHLYAQPQTIQCVFPSGFSTTAFNEINAILKTLWLAQKYESEIILADNEIHVKNIHLFAIIELLLRSQCLTDIRLVIVKSKVATKAAFAKKCEAIQWTYFLNKDMTIKIKVDSVASQLFHETSLKEILAGVVQPYVKNIVTGDNTKETTMLYVELNKNKLEVSISLAGDPLYKRGYKVLTATAPLREDIAACCIQRFIHFASLANVDPNIMLVPFSGTGTFVFEYLLYTLHIAPFRLGRYYAFQKMPLFRNEHFEYLKKKAQTHESLKLSSIIAIDKSPVAMDALVKNIESFVTLLSDPSLLKENMLSMYTENFLEKNPLDYLLKNEDADIFIPMNPPYGLRLNKTEDTVTSYKKIARKINDIAKLMKPVQKSIYGFILCPNEKTWSIFRKELAYSKEETYHFLQGGLDIRVCQFYIS